jgi:hypothetical protein
MVAMDLSIFKNMSGGLGLLFPDIRDDWCMTNGLVETDRPVWSIELV